MRSRSFITLFTSALLLSASLFLAPGAFAADVCPGTHLDKTGSDTLTGGGSISWGDNTLTYSVPDGGTLVLCIKAASEQAQGGGGTWEGTIEGPASGTLTTDNDTDAVSLGGHDISHISYTYTYVEPQNPTPPAAVASDECDDTTDTPYVNVTVTANDAAGPFDISLGGSVVHNDVSEGTHRVNVQAGVEYVITVAEDGKAAFETFEGSGRSDCAEETVVRSASITGSCAAGATAHLRGAPGDVFTVTVGGTAHEVTLDETGTANPKYALPENAETEVSVAGAATAVRTFDCTVEVENVVNERPVDNTTDPVDPVVVDDDDEVEVKPQVLEREELAFTGDYEDRLLVIALAFLGLGLPLTLVTPRRHRVTAR